MAAVLSGWVLCQRLGDCYPVPSFPVNVYEVLGRAGRIGAIFESDVNWVGETEWTLTGNFFHTHAFPLRLEIDWIDTIAEVSVNGKIIGETDNSFLSYSFPVTAVFSPAGSGVVNTVSIELKSVLKMGSTQTGQLPPCASQPWFCGVQYVRAPQSSFGWDFAPAIVNVGVGAVRLVSGEGLTKNISVLIDTHQDSAGWGISLRILPAISGNYTVELLLEGRRIMFEKFSDPKFNAHPNVSSWSPIGLGPQTLYDVIVCEKSTACVSHRIGFREVSYSSSGLTVNGHPVYLRGANWVGSLRPSSVPPFQAMLALGLNLIRVWGGGFYGDDALYRWADETGILVWEELNFACATYDGDNEQFMASVEKEIHQNLVRIHNHPSFVLLSGDNEIALMLRQNWFNLAPEEAQVKTAEYEAFSSKVLSQVSLINVGRRFAVIPSSPAEDTHWYDYASDCRDSHSYPSTMLVSEFGFQSWASDGVLESSGAQLDRDYRFSEFVKFRQHRPTGNAEIVFGIRKIFPDFDQGSVRNLVWASQISQAVCLKSAAETFRRQRTNSGIIVWQLNDVWPTVSWSLIDSGSLPKLAFHYLQSSLEAELVSIFQDQGGDIVVGVRHVKEGAQIPPFPVHLVHLLRNQSSTHFTRSALAGADFTELLRIPSCSGCVAAISPTNYILLGSVDRRRNEWPSVAFPVQVSTGKVWASIPTPFVHLVCAGGAGPVSPNALFLAPQFDPVTIPDCNEVEVKSHFWSFIENPNSWVVS